MVFFFISFSGFYFDRLFYDSSQISFANLLKLAKEKLVTTFNVLASVILTTPCLYLLYIPKESKFLDHPFFVLNIPLQMASTLSHDLQK